MANFDDPRVTTIGLFIEVGEALQRRIQELASHHNLSEWDVSNLLRLARSKGGRLRVTDLVVQSGWATQDVAGMAAGLEARGLAKLAHDPDDQQAVASITIEGAIALTAVLDDILGSTDGALATMGEERGIVEGAVRRIRDELHPAATAGGN